MFSKRQDQPPLAFLDLTARLARAANMQVVLTHLAKDGARIDTRGPRPILLIDIDSSPEAQESTLMEAVGLIVIGPHAAPGARRIDHLRPVEAD